jgi:hypothetical protein
MAFEMHDSDISRAVMYFFNPAFAIRDGFTTSLADVRVPPVATSLMAMLT